QAAQQAESKQRQEVEAQLYFNRVALAHNEWRAHSTGRALQVLQECPAERRGWEWHYLHRLCHSELLVLSQGHTGPLYAVAYSPDGRLLAVADSLDYRGLHTFGVIRLWDVAAGKLVWSLAGHGSSIAGLAFSPDGRRLASASDDGSV